MNEVHNLYSFNNIFEHSNARYLSSEQLAHEFVWTSVFESLITNKNHVILGSRGSGKTALVKMLSHECLSQLNHPKAFDIIQNKSFIATYLPLKVEWVISISDIDDDNQLFLWSLNLSSCARFIDTIKSCLHSYIKDPIQRAIKENKISTKLSSCWLNKELDSLGQISDELESIEFRKNVIFNKTKLGLNITDDEKQIGITFNSDLFKPMIMGIKIIRKELDIPDGSTFCLCIDEAEFLNREHHKIINSHMRSFGEMVFKITTMPYRHYTLETLTDSELNIGHDFEYLHIDKQGQKSDSHQYFEDFAERLFTKRLASSQLELDKRNVSLSYLLGESELIDTPHDSLPDSRFMEALVEYCDEKTVSRALQLRQENMSLFTTSIARKLKGTLLLKESYKNFKGNASPSIYSGYSLVVRCSDGNPRRLLRLLNHLFANRLSEDNGELLPIPPKEQGKRIREFSYSELEGLNIELRGKAAFELFTNIGRFLKEKLHSDKIGTDTFNSFNYDINDDEIWSHIETAVDLGLIYPDFRGIDNDNKMPNRKGKFSLAFCLSPYFYLMPRKGKSISLLNIIKYKRYAAFKRGSTSSEYGQIGFNFEAKDE